MEITNQLKNQHLLWRAGFGPAVEQLDDLHKYKPEKYYAALAKASSGEPQYINVAGQPLINAYEDLQDARKKGDYSDIQRREINRMLRTAVKDLNLYWLKEMITTPAQLREKMAFFWHGHFASRNGNIFYNQLLLNVFRQYALSDFGTLLKQVSHSASMLYFLNNQQNRKGRPNENFAREVMELFTLGRGHYTEKDIKEAARAFTGWASNAHGAFIFRENFHDDGIKTVLGKTGNFKGDDVLDIILENKQTAKFITQKIYRFFVNDNIDTAIVNQLADRFYSSNYNISKLMEDIFTSDWFYSEKNIGARIKSPVELLVGIQRMVPMKLDNDAPLFNLQRILGQQLLYPPNVAGWPGGKSWIDSSTLMMRLRIPQMFNDKDELNVAPKQDDDVMMGRKNDGTAAVPGKQAAPKKVYGAIAAKIDWAQYVARYDKTKKEDILSKIKTNLFLVDASGVENTVGKNIDPSSPEMYIKSATIQLMSTPEYQLC
ncbi:MAG: DUF1800 domain-containing protein [Niabella sp.]